MKLERLLIYFKTVIGRMMLNFFNSKDNLLVRRVNESVNKQVDELIKILHIRFERHVRLRILNQSKHNH